MSQSLVETRSSRRHRTTRAGHRALAFAAMAGWVLMPLMPLLALAFTWLSGLS